MLLLLLVVRIPPSAPAVRPLTTAGAAIADVDSLHACKAVLDALQAQLMLVRRASESRAPGAEPPSPEA